MPGPGRVDREGKGAGTPGSRTGLWITGPAMPGKDPKQMAHHAQTDPAGEGCKFIGAQGALWGWLCGAPSLHSARVKVRVTLWLFQPGKPPGACRMGPR